MQIEKIPRWQAILGLILAVGFACGFCGVPLVALLIYLAQSLK